MRLNFLRFPWKAKESLLAEINSHLVNACLSCCFLCWQISRLCFINNKLIYTKRKKKRKKGKFSYQRQYLMANDKRIFPVVLETLVFFILLIFLYRFFSLNKIIHFHCYNISESWINDYNWKTCSTSCPFFRGSGERACSPYSLVQI